MRYINGYFLLFSCLVLQGCGQMQTGTVPIPNDPLPKGTITAQAEFLGLNSQTASGVVVIYSMDTGSWIVRLEGVSLPVESGLQLIPVADSETVGTTALRSSKGTQNYSLTLASTPKWNKVRIHSTRTNTDYAEAIFK
ncbi:hypothetical protein WDW86_06770 [Bdellovibrionota bacterium FG-2]